MRDGKVGVTCRKRGRGEPAVDLGGQCPLGLLRRNRVAELIAIKVELDVGPGQRLALPSTARPLIFVPGKSVIRPMSRSLFGKTWTSSWRSRARFLASAQTVTSLSGLRPVKRNRPSPPVLVGPAFPYRKRPRRRPGN